MDWADHIRPAAKNGDNSLENGACICSACNAKKGDNSRDKEYAFLGGAPSTSYLRRFDQINPLTDASLRANAHVHWTDWYFNRAICNMDFGVSQLRLAKGNRQRYVRDSAHYAKVTLNFVKEWRRRRQTEGVSHPRDRGLVPQILEPDHHLQLQMFDAETEQDILDLQEALLPHYAGHFIFFLLKAYGFEDRALSEQLIQTLSGSDIDDGLWTVLNLSWVKEHGFVTEMVACHLAELVNGEVVPHPSIARPLLPARRTRRLIRILTEHHGLQVVEPEVVAKVIPAAKGQTQVEQI
jgi:hypothetical protein